jgi:hypothetical protein
MTAPSFFRAAIEVAGLEKGGAFYAELLDDPGRLVGGGRHYFDCGEVILALVDVAASGKSARPTAQNLYFAVSDLDAAYARATALGCLSQEKIHGADGGAIGKRPWGERSFYAVDPFGNKLCFVDRATLFTGKNAR